jgi:hypothetical protein
MVVILKCDDGGAHGTLLFTEVLKYFSHHVSTLKVYESDVNIIRTFQIIYIRFQVSMVKICTLAYWVMRQCCWVNGYLGGASFLSCVGDGQLLPLVGNLWPVMPFRFLVQCSVNHSTFLNVYIKLPKLL